MPKDINGISHRGANGLFDDDFDNPSHAQAHKMRAVQKMSRRQERQCAEQSRKEAKMARCLARGKPAESKLSYFFAKMLSKNDKRCEGFDRFEDEAEDLPEKIEVGTGHNAVVGETAVYRNRDWDTGAVESPWLKECGVIRVKSDEPGGCHIVAKPFILRNK